MFRMGLERDQILSTTTHPSVFDGCVETLCQGYEELGPATLVDGLPEILYNLSVSQRSVLLHGKSSAHGSEFVHANCQ